MSVKSSVNSKVLLLSSLSDWSQFASNVRKLLVYGMA